MAVVARSKRSSAPAVLLVAALLACCTARTAVAYSICDNVTCGMGSCAEAPGVIPGTVGYECDCQPGWSRVLQLLPFTPCLIPSCIDPACFNVTVFRLPRGISVTDICVAVDCGSGKCRNDGGMKFHCECDPGYQNVMNVTFLPCIRNCDYDGQGCIRPVLAPAPPPPPPPSSPAPLGSISLLLVSLATAAQIM